MGNCQHLVRKYKVSLECLAVILNLDILVLNDEPTTCKVCENGTIKKLHTLKQIWIKLIANESMWIQIFIALFQFSCVFESFFFYNKKLGEIDPKIHFTKNFKCLGINLTEGIQRFVLFFLEKIISSYWDTFKKI